MNDKLDQSAGPMVSRYKDALDLSNHHLKPAIKAKLDESRHQAVSQLSESAQSDLKNRFYIWQPALALAVPILAVAVIMTMPFTSEEKYTEAEIYADLEYLMEEEELDFLSELEISEWMSTENEG